MGFEVTKKNVKDVSSFLSQSELKKDRERKKSQSQGNLLASFRGLLRKKDRLQTGCYKTGTFQKSALHIYIIKIGV